MSGTVFIAPTASMLISAGQASVFPTGFGYYPAEGSRCVTAQYNWTSQASYYEDLSQLVARGVETAIQAIFVDNSGCTVGVQLLIEGTGQVVACPASSQGIFPVFFTGTPSLQIGVASVQANQVTRCCYLNVPPGGAGVWHI